MTNEERAAGYLGTVWATVSPEQIDALTAEFDAVEREAKVAVSNSVLERVREADRLFVRYGLDKNKDVVEWASGGQPVVAYASPPLRPLADETTERD